MDERYQSRPIRFIELWEEEGWRIKVYGITHQSERPRMELIASAKEIARRHLPQPSVTESRNGVGFLGVHDAKNACFCFVDWWEQRYELNHFLFRAPKDRPEELAPAQPGLTGCLWDLHLTAFERQAWLSALLSSPSPAIDTYLSMTLNCDV